MSEVICKKDSAQITVDLDILMGKKTSAELSLDDIVSLCDDLIEAHGEWLPEFKKEEEITFSL
ncbi:hypothetical protein V7150_12350 [Neobacillus drentensis]|uniref:hypothetical protein n=1 Tax=Neobacillus drentensis TaxID=220684 RepID=UPI002FFD87B2